MWCDRYWSTELLCVTSPYQPQPPAAAVTATDAGQTDHSGQAQGPVSVLIDGVQLDLNHTIFTYTDDPLITHVQPATSFLSFVSSSSLSLSLSVSLRLSVYV